MAVASASPSPHLRVKQGTQRWRRPRLVGLRLSIGRHLSMPETYWLQESAMSPIRSMLHPKPNESVFNVVSVVHWVTTAAIKLAVGIASFISKMQYRVHGISCECFGLY